MAGSPRAETVARTRWIVAAKVLVLLVLLAALAGSAARLAAQRAPAGPGPAAGEGYEPPYFEPHKARNWTLRPGTHSDGKAEYRVNSLRMRGAEVDPPDGRTRVLMMGDSCTFGLWLPEEDTIPRIVQGELDRAQPGRYVVFNGGIPGYSSFQALDHLATLGPEVKPDVVVLAYGANDVTMADRADKDHMKTTYGRYVQSISDDRPRRRRQARGEVRRVEAADFRQNLGNLVRLAREVGARQVVVLDLPFGTAVDDTHPFKPRFKEYRLLANEAAAKEGARVVDLQAAWEASGVAFGPRFFPDGIHPTAEGNHAIGTEVGRALLAP